MFYTEEDIQPVVDAAISIFGKQAQYYPAPFKYVELETPKYGKIWYGEVQYDSTIIYEKVLQLSKKINELVIVNVK